MSKDSTKNSGPNPRWMSHLTADPNQVQMHTDSSFLIWVLDQHGRWWLLQLFTTLGFIARPAEPQEEAELAWFLPTCPALLDAAKCIASYPGPSEDKQETP